MAIREAGRPAASVAQPVLAPVAVTRAQLGLWPIAKRLLDVVGSLALIAVAAVPMLLIALTIRLTSTGPAIFRQPRVGRGGRLFTSYKFRSMYMDAEYRRPEIAHLNEKDGPIFKMKEDPRTTLIGRFLRKSSLDELPQLFNVLRGDMSLVGPRPALMTEVLSYESWHLERMVVKPGLTGLWQVSGRSDLPFDEMIRLDIQYINGWSFWLDLWLLIRTVPAVLSGKGAY